VYVDRQDPELRRPLAIQGEKSALSREIDRSHRLGNAKETIVVLPKKIAAGNLKSLGDLHIKLPFFIEVESKAKQALKQGQAYIIAGDDGSVTKRIKVE